MSRWNFEPILESYLAVAALAGLLLLLLLLVQPAIHKLVARQRIVLATLRVLLILMLVVAMLRPALVSTQSRPLSATILLLYDESRSMQVEDGAQGQSRWRDQITALRSAGGPLAELAKDFDVRAYSFAEELKPSKFDNGRIQFSDAPRGRQTDIGAALDEMLRREAGKRLAAVVLMSDGAQRVYEPRVDVQQVARDLARLDCPLYTVSFGKPREQSQARDVAIENMRDQYAVFVKNELALRGALRVQGFVNRPLPVRVTVLKPNGDQETLGPINISAAEDDSLAAFEFKYSPQEPGDYRLTVEAEPQQGELVTDNNSITAYLTALDGGLRVLYLEGDLLGPEQQLLRRSIVSSADIQLDFRPIDPRLTSGWPVDLSADFEQNTYDIYLIGNVDADALGPENLARIAAEVASGKGLMMIGGLNTFGPGGYQDSPIAEVLPIAMGRFQRQEFGAEVPVREELHVPGPFRMIPTGPHFITNLGQDRWDRLKPLSGANRFDSIKPRAMILARSDSQKQEPLLIGWQYDGGRVLVFAADSTHLWWRHGQQPAHKRFWRQSLLWLGNKDELTRRDVWVRLQRRRYRPGERVEFTAGAQSESGDVLTDLSLAADLIGPTGDRQPIKLSRQDADWTGLCDDVLEAGEYQIEVRATSPTEEIGQAAVRFLVQDLDLELSDPAANPDRLRRMSWMTRDAGGQVVVPEQLNDLFREILERPPLMEIDVESKLRFGDTGWETWSFFVIFVAVLGCEWWLRKEWGMA